MLSGRVPFHRRQRRQGCVHTSEGRSKVYFNLNRLSLILQFQFNSYIDERSKSFPLSSQNKVCFYHLSLKTCPSQNIARTEVLSIFYRSILYQGLFFPRKVTIPTSTLVFVQGCALSLLALSHLALRLISSVFDLVYYLSSTFPKVFLYIILLYLYMFR